MSSKLEYSPEKKIAGQAKFLPMKKLMNLGEKKICKIICSNSTGDIVTGTGFFCSVVMDEWESLKMRVLITNNHVLNEDKIKFGKKIKFTTNDDEQNYEIEIDKERTIFTSKKYDITIIEIKKEDKIQPDAFFEIDDSVFKPDYNYKNKIIYLLHYPNGKEMSFSQGTIKKVGKDENDYEIFHLCSSDHGSSGGPLISEDFKVIAIHKGAPKQSDFNFNYGTLLKEPIIEFRKQIKNKNKENKNERNDNIKKKNFENLDKEKKENYNEMKEKKKKENNIDNNENNNVNELIDDNNEDIDEITIDYKIEDIDYSKKIRLFGDEFVENNKNICKIIIDKEECNLATHFNVDNNQIKDDIFEIRLKGIKNIINMSHMFAGKSDDYVPLSSLPDISKLNTKMLLI
jgi:V8-like Glu-specific endopeptidase